MSPRASEPKKELHEAQAELAHVTRVTALGELAASIAHEVNQPLAAVVANAAACQRWLDRDPPDLEEARSTAQSIIKDGKRAGDVIQRVRALVNKTTGQKVPLDINEVVNEVITLLRHELISHRMSLRMELAPALGLVLGDRVQLQQVILNLVINGIEAMQPVTGRLRELVIRTHEEEARQILVTVSDCGVGWAAENADRHVRRILHHQIRRHGHGPVDLPIDRRVPRRATVGLQQWRAWCDVSVHLAAASRGQHAVTEPLDIASQRCKHGGADRLRCRR